MLLTLSQSIFPSEEDEYQDPGLKTPTASVLPPVTNVVVDEDEVAKLPDWIWIPWFEHLVAALDSPNSSIIKFILARLVKSFPQAVGYQILEAINHPLHSVQTKAILVELFQGPIPQELQKFSKGFLTNFDQSHEQILIRLLQKVRLECHAGDAFDASKYLIRSVSNLPQHKELMSKLASLPNKKSLIREIDVVLSQISISQKPSRVPCPIEFSELRPGVIEVPGQYEVHSQIIILVFGS